MKKEGTLVMTFGTFDLFHPGHKYYLSEARKLGDELITVVARDATVEKIKGRKPRENELSRLKNVQDAHIASQVVLGSKDLPYAVIEEYQPDILCFGYDQKSFNDERLQKFLAQHHLSPKIIILPAFEADRWKSSKL